jgi:hypothetical protein
VSDTQARLAHERDYIARTIATVRIHKDADNCWPQWANIFADQIESLEAELERVTAALLFIVNEGRVWDERDLPMTADQILADVAPLIAFADSLAGGARAACGCAPSEYCSSDECGGARAAQEGEL